MQRWIRAVLAAAVLAGLPAPACAADPPDVTAASQAGSAAASSARGQLGDAGALRDRVAAPLTSSETPMRTLDGSTPFNAQMLCPSSAVFLTVLVQPGATGDLQTVTVYQDRDMDGQADHAFTVPGAVSGICGNGVITCTPGTWSGCSFHRWAVGAEGRVGLEATGMSALGGCYCINSSCGSDLAWTNLPVLLRDLGGGVAGAVQAANPKFTITGARIDGASIAYHGQASGQCAQAAGGAGSASPEAYYGDAPGMASAASAAAAQGLADPGSVYSQALTAFSGTGSSTETRTCAVNRTVTLEVRGSSAGGSGSGGLCVDHYLYMRIHRESPTRFYLQYLDTSPGGAPHWNCGGAGSGGGVGDWHTVQAVDVEMPAESSRLTSAVFCQSISGPGCGAQSGCLDGAVQGFDNAVYTGLVCGAAGAQTPSYTYTYDFRYEYDVLSESEQNGCAAVESDSSCRLMEERVDGVTTYRDFNPTGLTPIASCRTWSGVGAHELCRGWWRKERVYRCTADVSFDASAALQRHRAVSASVQDGGGVMTFTDTPAGAPAASYAVSLMGRAASESCEKACVVRRPVRDTQAGIAGPVTGVRTDPSSWERVYRACAGGACPVEAGETLERDCACLSDFGEAVGAVSAVAGAAKDMICSDGVKK